MKDPLKELSFSIKAGVVIRREKNQGFEEIAYESLEWWNGQFRLWYSAVKRIDPVEKIWDDYFLDLMPLGVGEAYVNTTIFVNARVLREYQYDPANRIKWRRMNDYHLADATEEGVVDLAEQFLKTLKTYIIPTFEKYNNIQLLDAFVNERPEYFFETMHLFPDRGFEYKKMIIAKLAGNNDFQLVCDAVRQNIINTEYVNGDLPKETYCGLFEKVYERLKNELPLNNPVVD
ncbi:MULTISPECIES: hypothetical protein [Niastella]|uniref:Uncharacterized protein n=1 Tax=Niastella soli TaxID=2821487 RepID=A0ABS3YW88_9BACT|nr:hypothetical protein [Niastella soli]MBO9201431.1 hypothetical protein [Niastella soli]